MLPERSTSTQFSPVVVAPTFNNSVTLAEILGQIEQLQLPVIVINDGSTDRTSAVLERFPSMMVITHSINLGKAAALAAGFQAGACRGFTHVLTIDTDGQHDPAEIPRLLELARQSPGAVVLGSRDYRITGYPLRNRLGRTISNALVWLESGLRVADTQCGLRVYPLEVLSRVRCAASRYGYETEILTRAAWLNIPVVQTKVHCRYSEIPGLVSHFDPLADSLRAAAMHVKLTLEALPRWPRRLASACDPLAAWRRLRTTPAARNEFAGGLALGVFFACLPLYGVQGVLSFFTARVLRLNRLSAVAGSQLSTPPLSAVLIAASLACGHFLLHGSWPDAASISAVHGSIWSLALLRAILLDWIVGGMLVGAVLSAATYLAVRATLAAGSATSA
jgi:uncharacterized protein (DUF2062 family)